MIILYHGDNQVTSRNALQEYLDIVKKSGKSEIVRISADNLDLTNLLQTFESRSLFGQERLIVLENIFSLKSSKFKQDALGYLANLPPKTQLVIWEKKPVSAALLKKIKIDKIYFFKISKKIFSFLDSLRPANARNMLLLLREAEQNDVTELIFYFLSRRISLLLVAKDRELKSLNNLQSWQKSKLITQANSFSLKQLLLLHEKCYTIDREIKNGTNVLPLISLLDLLVFEISAAGKNI